MKKNLSPLSIKIRGVLPKKDSAVKEPEIKKAGNTKYGKLGVCMMMRPRTCPERDESVLRWEGLLKNDFRCSTLIVELNAQPDSLS